MLFWGTILSSTLSAGPSTESEVKRHKVLSTSKSLALFCSGLVILLANEASEAIRHECRVPGGAAQLQRVETTCAAGCSLKSSRRRCAVSARLIQRRRRCAVSATLIQRRRRSAVPATLIRRRTFVQRRSANSFSIYYRSSSLHQRRRRRRAYMSRAYLHSLSTALSPFFESYDDYIYECDERVPTAVCHSYIQAAAAHLLPHTYTYVHCSHKASKYSCNKMIMT